MFYLKKNVAIIKDLPEEFDARKQWAKCNSVIGLIRDQSECGSCWAFGTTEAFNDRYCIHKGDTKLLSAADTNSCGPGDGCSGGQPDKVWPWFESSGVCTGGLHNDTKTCKPYEFEPCEHHGWPYSKKYPPCKDYPTPKCTSKCTNPSYQTAYSNDKHKGSSSYSVGGVEAIMSEIMTKGPVASVFTVYSDFPTYRKGVYSPGSTAVPLGGHCIKILGWGNDGHCKSISGAASDNWCVTNCCGNPPNCPATLCKCDKPNPGGYYWLVANSWNEDWGDQGFFKMKKGSNTCEIEIHVSAGMP